MYKGERKVDTMTYHDISFPDPVSTSSVISVLIFYHQFPVKKNFNISLWLQYRNISQYTILYPDTYRDTYRHILVNSQS